MHGWLVGGGQGGAVQECRAQDACQATRLSHDAGSKCSAAHLLLEGVQRRLQLLPQELEQQVAGQQHLVVRGRVRVVLRALPVRLWRGGRGGIGELEPSTVCGSTSDADPSNQRQDKDVQTSPRCPPAASTYWNRTCWAVPATQNPRADQLEPAQLSCRPHQRVQLEQHLHRQLQLVGGLVQMDEQQVTQQLLAHLQGENRNHSWQSGVSSGRCRWTLAQTPSRRAEQPVAAGEAGNGICCHILRPQLVWAPPLPAW